MRKLITLFLERGLSVRRQTGKGDGSPEEGWTLKYVEIGNCSTENGLNETACFTNVLSEDREF